ncbi:VOC family protein [Cellulomonas sp. DKR-3]|uniref:VOC family protein n=1 Tax=Cellulomonas fulva TaxID=2835530 RepID=A0ABS5TY87_9CELL|nr:VOC family protein [Cellulomonas fulva]MBT0994108.1 VOC family protein [Cellulomonas fulva]
MSVVLNPYLGFAGNAREALEFYQSVLGGELTISTFAESGMPDAGDGVMHGQLTAPGGITLMASDSPTPVEARAESSITISLSGDDEATLRRYWDGLAEGASITEPLVTAPWGDTFGMLTDRFGTAWMVNISAAG